MNTTVTVETVTPKLAAKWLAATDITHQRPLSPSHVEALTADILADRWVLNGESIILNGTAVVDGQHRLTAVVKANRSITSVVVRNVDSTAFVTIDSGRKRGVHDVLSIAGYTKGRYVTAAVLRWLYAEAQGALHWQVPPKMPHSEALSLMAAHDLSDSMSTASRYSARLLTPSIAVFLHYRFSQGFSTEAVEAFFEALDRGANLESDRPVFLLRQRLLTNKTATKTKMLQRELMAITIKAFYADMAGQKLRQLVFRGEGRTAEAFPVLPQVQ